VALADELVHGARPHALGERRARGRRRRGGRAREELGLPRHAREG
jgi:hypothetical protein